MWGKPILLFAAVLLAVAPVAVLSASEQCADLVPDLVTECPAFEFAKENDLSFSIDAGEPAVKAQAGPFDDMKVIAFDRIMEQDFDDKCCGFMRKMNESRCFCESDVVAALQSDMQDELLAFTIFTAARPKASGGCGGMIFAALDGEDCLPLGPTSDAVEEGSEEDCEDLEDALRDSSLLGDSFVILGEALDVTGLLDTIADLSAYTLFAPTDSAFRAFVEDQGLNQNDLLQDLDALDQILREHLVASTVSVRELAEDGESADVLSTQGTPLDLEVFPTGDVTANGTPIDESDVEVCGGLIQVVPAVLSSVKLQPGKNDEQSEGSPIVTTAPSQAREEEDEVAEETEDTMEEAPKKPAKKPVTKDEDEECEDGSVLEVLAAFEEAFGMLLEEVDEVEDVKKLLESEGPITLFAPINTEIEIEEMVNGTKSVEDVRKSLRRLIVLGKFNISRLSPGTELVSVGKDELKITDKDGLLHVNGVRLIQADVEACNGVIHVVKEPLPKNPADEDEEEEEKVEDEEEEAATTKEPAPKETKEKEVKKKKVKKQPAKPAQPPKRNPDKDAADDEDEEEAINAPEKPKKEITITTDTDTEEESDAEEETDTVTESSAACACSSDGISAGIDTGRAGCAQHLLNHGNNTFFCYLEDEEACEEAGGVLVFDSYRFSPAKWRVCTREEAKEQLPTLQSLISEVIQSLEPVERLFNTAGLNDTLKQEGPWTVFVPSRLAVGRAVLSTIFNRTSPDNEMLKKIMRNHVVKGTFTAADLNGTKELETLQGVKVPVRVDEDDSILIGDSATVLLSDMFGSNGVAHLVDDMILDDVVEVPGEKLLKDPCGCSADGVSGGTETGRPGCQKHIPGTSAFCYVKDPERCTVAEASNAFPGAKWLNCEDPCSCATDGVSGRVPTGRGGCARHVWGSAPFCYVVDPDNCPKDTPSEVFPGATWKWCKTAPPRPFLSYGSEPASAMDDPCACSRDGVSGGVYTGRSGCGRFGVLFAPFKICYVVEPSHCPLSLPSIRARGAAWRMC